MKDIMWDSKLIDHQDYDFVARFSKKYKMTVKKEPTVVFSLSSGRANHFETCIRFVEDNIKDIDPDVYRRYNLGMYLKAEKKEEYKKFASYFQKETIRYKEFVTYQYYISVCNPQNRFREWIDKWIYIFYILKIKIEI